MPSMRQTARATARARELRTRMTDAEAKLSGRLRASRLLEIKFRRQVPIGDFIVDVCSRNPKLIIELDGGQHSEPQQEDAARTARLREHGYTVLRFWGDEVLK